jgi:hypothetical protein
MAYYEDCLACQYEAGEITQAYDDHIHGSLWRRERCKHNIDIHYDEAADPYGCVVCYPSEVSERRLADFRKATLYALGCQGYDGAPSSGFPDHERARDVDDVYPSQGIREGHECSVACNVVNDRPDLEAVPPVAPAEWFGGTVQTLDGPTTVYLRPEIVRSPQWLRAYMSGSYPVMRDATSGEVVGAMDTPELIDTGQRAVKIEVPNLDDHVYGVKRPEPVNGPIVTLAAWRAAKVSQ